MRRFAVIAPAVLAALILSAPTSAASGWTKPQRVGDAPYSQPSMVVDGQGAVHLVARGRNGLWYSPTRAATGRGSG